VVDCYRCAESSVDGCVVVLTDDDDDDDTYLQSIYVKMARVAVCIPFVAARIDR
jgi:hypothetical protein